MGMAGAENLQARDSPGRLLGTFGLFLALYVVVTATRRQLVLGFYKDAIYPQNYALLIGLLLAAVLALFHVSATMAINWRANAYWTNTHQFLARAPMISPPH